ncbi:MAG: VOC family protein [Isosphaeraceae bacterium]
MCTNADRSTRFYCDVLGAIALPSDNGFGWWLRLGTFELNLLPNAVTASPAVFPTHAMPILWLEVPNLAEAAAWFARHKVVVVDPGDGQYMQVADPDGLLIEVWQAQAAD